MNIGNQHVTVYFFWLDIIHCFFRPLFIRSSDQLTPKFSSSFQVWLQLYYFFPLPHFKNLESITSIAWVLHLFHSKFSIYVLNIYLLYVFFLLTFSSLQRTYFCSLIKFQPAFSSTFNLIFEIRSTHLLPSLQSFTSKGVSVSTLTQKLEQDFLVCIHCKVLAILHSLRDSV